MMRNWFFEQMAMYSAYHRDGRNQATHHIGVPLIVFSILVLAAQVPLVTLAIGPLTLAGALISILLLVYIIAVPMVGIIATFVYMVLLYIAEQFGPNDSPYLIFATCFVGGWIIQFIGHGFEGRKPALFDNLLQIFMAPAFLIAEILFTLKLQNHLEEEIAARIDKYLPQGKEATS
ncbi:DUF962 domain-containing protein [Kordiimonas sp. SCSIO 12610]|uniref:Mpo1 family 2-hydroxy fatty acid dioxygenase n=1 Tax=Kordiimonas sp. SCSIO 12610 TaxID=2829597 RepID=UPI00210AEC45|nr:Mpo1-like protein [Kordiimonas sp. SCSIO 12610]UTW55635.1 DUF962 domain-containing protein [Kordiimonas sp. SCSIO 12610]